MNTALLPLAQELERSLDHNNPIVRGTARERIKADVTRQIMDDAMINRLLDYMPKHYLPVSNTIFLVQRHKHGHAHVTDILPATDLDTINI